MYFCGGGKRNKTLFLNVCVYVCNCCFVIEFKRGGGGEGGNVWDLATVYFIR